MKKKIGTYLINTIGVVSGILTIIMFVTSVFNISFEKIYITIDLNYFLEKWSIWIFVIALILLIISILIKLNIKKKEVVAKEYFFLKFNELLLFIQKSHSLQDRTNGLEFDIFMQEVLERMRRIISIYSKRPVNTKVMLILEQNGEQFVKTRWLSSSTQERGSELAKFHKISDNTSFSSLLKGKGSYFCYSTKDRIFDKLYKTSDEKWRQKYSSLLVLPIKQMRDNEEKVIGFLSLDSIDPNVFDINADIVIAMVQTIVSYLGVVIRECDDQKYEDIEMKEEIE